MAEQARLAPRAESSGRGRHGPNAPLPDMGGAQLSCASLEKVGPPAIPPNETGRPDHFAKQQLGAHVQEERGHQLQSASQRSGCRSADRVGEGKSSSRQAPSCRWSPLGNVRWRTPEHCPFDGEQPLRFCGGVRGGGLGEVGKPERAAKRAAVGHGVQCSRTSRSPLVSVHGMEFPTMFMISFTEFPTMADVVTGPPDG